MGMFDEITVSRTYLKDLLSKEQEKILKHGDDIYQTKDLKNCLSNYKIYRRKLWEDTSSSVFGDPKGEEKPKPLWEEVKITQEVSFCNLIVIDGTEHWFEFRFTFNNGKIDRKFLDDYSVRSKEELEKEQEEWNIIRSYYDAHQNRFLIKILDWMANKFLSISTSLSRKAAVPLEIKKAAYKAAGREYNNGCW